MSSAELLKAFQKHIGMITKSDIQVSQRIANYGRNMIPSYLNGSQELPMENNEYPYRDSYMYPPSFFELTDNCGGRNFFESMINSFTAKGEEQSKSFSEDELFTTNPADILENKVSEKNHGVKKKRRITQSPPKGCLSSLELFKDSDLVHFNSVTSENIKEESPFTFSRPVTPAEPLIDPSDSSNPLAQLEHTSFDQLIKDSPSEHGSQTPKHSFSDQNSYDTSSLMYGNDDLTMFSSLVNCNEVLRNHKSSQSFQQLSPVENIVQVPLELLSSAESPKQVDVDPIDVVPLNVKKEVITASPLSSLNSAEEGRKNKLSGLHRRALDSIFYITDRPSRGLVLHIATELCLHHITVKNFFSNGRRRLRRAAARLSDPERTRRENQRRKEKRRLAALAATASTAGSDKGSSIKVSVGEGDSDSHAQREPSVLSPQRKALMEKLAVKVQRSVAQKGLQQAMMNNDNNKSPGNLPASQKVSCQLTHNLESILNSHIHSNTISSPVEPAQTFSLLPIREGGYQPDSADNISNFFSYTEGDQFSSYHPSPDQDLLTSCVNQDQNNVPYCSTQEEPYSPTSWQTLLNT